MLLNEGSMALEFLKMVIIFFQCMVLSDLKTLLTPSYLSGGGGGGGEICSKKYKADEEKITTKKRYVTGFQMVALYC